MYGPSISNGRILPELLSIKILREYIENSVYVKSLEMTTDEIVKHRFSLPFNVKEIDGLLDRDNKNDIENRSFRLVARFDKSNNPIYPRVSSSLGI